MMSRHVEGCLLLVLCGLVLIVMEEVRHKRWRCSDDCSRAVCGISKCKKCSYDPKLHTEGIDLEPPGICYNEARRRILCNSDADCELWEICLHEYVGEGQFTSWSPRTSYCVEAMPAAHYLMFSEQQDQIRLEWGSGMVP